MKKNSSDPESTKIFSDELKIQSVLSSVFAIAVFLIFKKIKEDELKKKKSINGS